MLIRKLLFQNENGGVGFLRTTVQQDFGRQPAIVHNPAAIRAISWVTQSVQVASDPKRIQELSPGLIDLCFEITYGGGCAGVIVLAVRRAFKASTAATAFAGG